MRIAYRESKFCNKKQKWTLKDVRPLQGFISNESPMHRVVISIGTNLILYMLLRIQDGIADVVELRSDCIFDAEKNLIFNPDLNRICQLEGDTLVIY